MRFVKQELRGIGVKAQDRGHHCTANLSEEAVAVLDKMWNKAIHECKDPAEPSLSERGGHRTTEVSDYTMFELTVKRHWRWLYENWKTLLPKT
ncbi:MAG TPA: hypothetical protein VLN58_03460 [Verrucomicrobiae bacterium]|nr:hypothetical protein [Verrucomicrobiae bacterium]